MRQRSELQEKIGMECDSGKWDEMIAERLAEREGIPELTDEHWRLLCFLREHYIQYGAAPPMHVACSHNHMEPHCESRLFHGAREAWHIAGLPDPGEEAMAYME